MKIDLKFFMNKNRINLEKFCEINNIQSYDQLVDYCKQKRLICVSQEFYSSVFPVNITKDDKHTKEKNAQEKVPKVNAKTRGSGRTRKTRKTRSVNKKDDV